MNESVCRLRLAAEGRAEPCPRERCAFWEPQGSDARCFVERVGADLRQAGLAAYLLETRECLERARDLSEAERAHREFSRHIGLEL